EQDLRGGRLVKMGLNWPLAFRVASLLSMSKSQIKTACVWILACLSGSMRPMLACAQKPNGASGGRQRAGSRSVFAWRVAAVFFALGTPGPAAEPMGKLDPAAWGSDHAGKAVPESITGDECLFCHRLKIGPGWPQNRHQSTIRRIDPEALT